MPGEGSEEFVEAAVDILNEGTDDVQVEDDDLNGNVNLVTASAGAEDEEEQDPTETPETPEDEKEASEEGVEGEDPKLSEIPHYQEIKGKYPNLFKEFPGLKAAYFFGRDAQVTFGSIENVKRAGEMLDDYQEISRDLFSGKLEGLFDSLKGGKKLDKFAENMLPQLYKTDQDTYIKVTEPVIAGVLRQALREGEGRKDQNLINAAKLLSREIFGKTDIPDFKRREAEPDPEKEELRTRLSEVAQRTETAFVQDINTNGERLVKAEISKLIPKEATKYQQGIILKESYAEIEQLMLKDQAHLAQMRPLWQGARRAGFVGDWKSQILRAALARAKQSINSVTKKHTMEITGKAPVQPSGTGNPKPKGDPQSGSARPTSIRPIVARNIDTRKTSAMDILNDKIEYKK